MSTSTSVLDNMFSVNTRVAKEFVTHCMISDVVPYMVASPGVGKSAICHEIAFEQHLHMIDHRLSTSAPEDMSGLPRFNNRGRAEFSPFEDLFPLEGDPLPEGKVGWLLFLDEFPSASKAVQAAAYKLILDRMVGQHRLHPQVFIVCAGNKMSDRAIVNPLGSAMRSRLVHISVEVDFDIWLQDVALKKNWDKRIIAFLSQYPSKLMDFDPADTTEATFCCPRTWEFTNKLVKNMPHIDNSKAALFAGTITSGVAVEFVQFTQVFASIVKIDEILKNPGSARMPQDRPSSWATVATMMEHIDDKNFGALAEYANRFDTTFKILFYRATMIRQPALRRHAAFSNALVELSRYLNG